MRSVNTPPVGFDTEAHRRYIDGGGCPYVHVKTWCSGRRGDLHQDHWAPYLLPSGTTKRVVFDPDECWKAV